MMSSADRLSAQASTSAVLGSIRHSADSPIILGRYKAVHRRVKPEHLPAAMLMLERISFCGPAEKAHWTQELIDLPRDVVSVDEYDNLVTDVGAKLLLDTILAGSGFTATAIMGLKGSGAAAVGDTQASHAGWLEVGTANAPAYTAPRKSVTFSAASGSGAGARTKASSSTQTFVFTSGGTVDGSFININGTTAIDNTTGTLFSAGTFSAPGAKTVAATDTLTVTYSLAV